MTDYGTATCTECGHESPRLLAPRFPHICRACLFPSTAPVGMVADLYAKATHTRAATPPPSKWRDAT